MSKPKLLVKTEPCRCRPIQGHYELSILDPKGFYRFVAHISVDDLHAWMSDDRFEVHIALKESLGN